ncbi:glycosyltransferase [Aridibaculum aurantiacum]|uniref:glycosyltransferase n=1 Tax=Aridibaculum aurantiacum TaxID=2810307 RepID=UPI001A9592D3|nr:glycosyltransferase [Aridibaculum aurantiacum]
MDQHIHIICLNVPYPVNYGGVFDLFYKLPALHKLGVKIHLHCFEYGRGEQPELNKYCASVHYYKRSTGPGAFSFSLPYIVSSRKNEELLARLAQDDHPILMEGIHCTYLLHDTRFTNRKCFVRLHNVEYIYYNHLADHTNNLLKKAYYKWESKLLTSYEKKTACKATFWSVIEPDAEIYRRLGCKRISFLPLFLPPWKVNSKEGKGTYCLYHGDLSVAENEKAVEWLLTNILQDIDIPLVIAGKNPSNSLYKKTEGRTDVCLVANPGNEEMQDMIAKAHMHLIPSFNNTGIKLKLINALFNGRHCVVNNSTVKGTGLEAACLIANTAAEMKHMILEYYQKPFTEKDLQVRHQLLDHMFDNDANAQKLVKWIWQ